MECRRSRGAEHVRPLPGDDLIPEPLAALTHAITIHRDRGAVWPWLAQMGAGSRAGRYSYDFLDNGGHPSAARLVPELQSIGAGTLLPALPGITEGDAHTGPATRLIVRARGGRGYRFHGLPGPLSKPLISVVHAVMQRRQLLGLAQRAESTAPIPPSPASMPEPEEHRV